MSALETKQPVVVLVGMIETMLKRSEQYRREAEEDGDLNDGEKHARVSSVLKELVRLGKGLGAAAVESAKASDAESDRVRMQRVVSLAARWLEEAKNRRADVESEKALGGGDDDATIGYCECLEDKAAELRKAAGSEANVCMSDAPPKPSDSPSACQARSTPCSGSETPLNFKTTLRRQNPGGGGVGGENPEQQDQ